MSTAAKVTPLCRSAFVANADLSAGVYDISAGVLEAPGRTHHALSLHLGQPVWASCGWVTPMHRRLQHEGDLSLTPAGVAGVWQGETPARFLLVHITSTLVRQVAGEMGIERPELSFVPVAQFRDAQLGTIAWALKFEVEAGEPNGRPYLDGLGVALAARLVSRYAPKQRAIRPPTLWPGRMRDVVDHIEAHIDESLTLHRLAGVAGLGLSQFKTVFRRAAGIPLHRYIIRRRVERARLLLMQGTLSMSQVALATGFAHQSHMARHMRRLHGVSPSALLGSS